MTEDFLRYEFGGLIFLGGGLYLEGPVHGGAYFRNFTVLNCSVLKKGPFLESSRNYQAGNMFCLH